jgi:nucleotide-binding universal stress UspA family protein
MIRSIMVGTDTSPAATLAVEEAAQLAQAHDAELVVLYVRPPVDAREMFDPAGIPDVDRHLEELTQRLAGVKVRTRQEAGDPAETICDVAEKEGVDVIVVGNRGTRGRRRWFLGSVPNAVVQHSPCSVFIVDTREAQ